MLGIRMRCILWFRLATGRCRWAFEKQIPFEDDRKKSKQRQPQPPMWRSFAALGMRVLKDLCIGLLEAGADGDAFGDGGEVGLAAFFAGG